MKEWEKFLLLLSLNLVSYSLVERLGVKAYKGEIMKELTVFEGKNVEVLGLEGKVLFNPRDCGKCLDLTDSGVRDAIRKMNENQVVKVTNSNVAKLDIRKIANRGENFLTESGVYQLVFQSNKPDATKFKKPTELS